MSLRRLLAVGAFATTVACSSSSTPTAPISGGQVLPPGGQMGGSSAGQTPSPPPSDTVGVTIQDFTFSPASLTIKAGTSVRWTNDGPSAHTTTSDMGVWSSGVLSPPGSADSMTGGMNGGGGSAGGTFDFRFTQPGTYPYHCALHPPNLYPGFVGTVTVTQ
jgi:plastocyanin